MLKERQDTGLTSPSHRHLVDATARDIPFTKVSIIVGDLSATGAGRWGGAVRPFLLSKALRNLGLAVEIVGFSTDEAPLMTDSDVTIKRFPYQPYPQFVGAALQLINSLDGNLLYAYKTKASSFGVGLLARRIRQLPLILDIDDWEMSWHGGDEWHYRPSIKQRYRDMAKSSGALRQPDHPVYLKRMEAWVPQADAVTVHTRFLQQRFGGIYIPNGKDTELFDPGRYSYAESRRKYGLENCQVLMFPGAPRPYKGLEDVLAALDFLDWPRIKLVIVGGSPYDDYDDSLRQRWGQRIVQLPRLSPDQMPEVVAAADAIVVPQQDTPTAQAQFPLKLTDGMAMAKPVLATRVGDIPDILGDAGYLVPAGDYRAMAQRIEAILTNPNAAAEQGRRARRRCQQRYSICSMADGLATLLPTLSTR